MKTQPNMRSSKAPILIGSTHFSFHHESGPCKLLPLCLKVVCYSCSPQASKHDFLSFHMIWLKTAGNLNVSFGVLHWLRTELQTRESRLAQAVLALESTDQNLVLHDAVRTTMAHDSSWNGRDEWGPQRRPSDPGMPEPGVCVRNACVVWELCWLRLSILTKSLQRAKQCRLFLARPGLLRSVF